MLGMTTALDGDGRILVRMDERIARFVIDPTGADRGNGAEVLETVAGWECRSEEAFERVHAAIEGAGVETIHSLTGRPWCRKSFECVDPSGLRCEFFYGGKVDPARQFVSPLGISFVTGDQGMGHITIASSDVEGAVEFYQQLLGFQVRETKTVGGARMRWAFLSPNTREHSLALMASEGQSRVLHLLVEVPELDAVGRAMDRCLDGLAPMTISLGRHWNDGMVSFYLRTPSGFDIEYGFGGKVVDLDGWTRIEQGGSELVSLWGHRVIQSDGTLGLQIGQHSVNPRLGDHA